MKKVRQLGFCISVCSVIFRVIQLRFTFTVQADTSWAAEEVLESLQRGSIMTCAFSPFCLQCVWESGETSFQIPQVLDCCHRFRTWLRQASVERDMSLLLLQYDVLFVKVRDLEEFFGLFNDSTVLFIAM